MTIIKNILLDSLGRFIKYGFISKSSDQSSDTSKQLIDSNKPNSLAICAVNSTNSYFNRIYRMFSSFITLNDNRDKCISKDVKVIKGNKPVNIDNNIKLLNNFLIKK